MAGNSKLKESKYIVVLLDILGEDHRLKSAHTRSDRQIAYQRIKWFRQLITEGFPGTIGPSQQLLSLANPQNPKAFIKQYTANTKFTFFSDTALFYALYADTSSLLAMFQLIAFLFLTCHIKGIFFRGGIDFGYACELEHGLYGPVLQRVHALEHCKANFPRVLISDKLQKSIERRFRLKRKPDATSRLAGVLSDLAAKCITQDIRDDKYIVDYLGEGFLLQQDSDTPKWNRWQSLVVDAYQSVSKERAKSHSDNQEKYDYLNEYYEKNLANWRIRITNPEQQ